MFIFPVNFFKSQSLDPYFSNVVFLAHFNGVNEGTTFTDLANNNITATNVTTSTNQSKFNGSSASFNGTNSSLSVVNSTSWSFTGDFTIEFWCYFNSVSSQQCLITNSSNSVSGWAIQLVSGKLGCNLQGDELLITGTTTINANTWYFITLIRSGANFKLYLNNIQEGSTYSGTSNLSGSTLNIGKTFNLAYFNGYLAELRITNGIARTVTLPTQPFPNY